MNRIIVALQIVCLSTWASIVYGILHDQVTVRVCLEYFTIGHVPIFGDQPPTILAILWGTTASWWMGTSLGIFLALAAALGPYPVCRPGMLVRPILTLLIVMAVAACISGICGYNLQTHHILNLAEIWDGASLLPPAKHAAFMADAFAHNASYFVGFFGALYLTVNTFLRRRRINKSDLQVAET